MKDNPINLTIPPGTRVLTIGFGETVAESDDAIRSAFEKAEQNGSATVAMSEMKKATGLDILRQRGTPIELIGSALASQDWKTANAAFRTTILEYVYEKIAAFCGAEVRFVNSRDLHRREEQLGYIVEQSGSFTVIGLVPEHETLPAQGAGIAKVAEIHSGLVQETIDDHITASTMAIVEKVTGNIIAEITPPLNKPGTGNLHIGIVVDLFDYKVGLDKETIQAEVRVPLFAYRI